MLTIMLTDRSVLVGNWVYILHTARISEFLYTVTQGWSQNLVPFSPLVPNHARPHHD
jgi:hypothetical protein